MDDRTALLLAWLEGEGERQRRPVLPPPQARDPALRGWVQVGVCTFGGAVAAGLFVCWLIVAWGQEMRMTCVEELRQEGIGTVTDDPYRPPPTPRWYRERGVTARRDDGAFGVALCVTGFALALGTVIGAGILRAACALYNKLAGGEGSPNSVPNPLLGKALSITFLTTLSNAVAGLAIRFLVGAGGAATGAEEQGGVVLAPLLSLAVGVLVLAGLASALLPTTFARGLLVALCYLLVGLFVVIVLAIVFAGLLLVGALLR